MNLVTLVDDFVAYKQALGYRYTVDARILYSLCRHTGDILVSNVTPALLLAFLQQPGSGMQTRARKQRSVAALFRYALSRQLCTATPLPQLPSPGPSTFEPYIYSHDELRRLLAACAVVCSDRRLLEENTFRSLLLTLYGAGLRLSEALMLDDGDVDLRQAVLTIHQTKFYKSRFVPIGSDLLGVLSGYQQQRTGEHSADFSAQAPFFRYRDGRRIAKSTLQGNFRQLCREAGVSRLGARAREQPRLHDLRHTAAVHRLIEWYHRGADLQRLLPVLATYLGHVDLLSTQRYLTLTPELLQQASHRFEVYAQVHDHG